MTSTAQLISEDVELLSVLLWQYDGTDTESIEGLIKSKGLWYRTQVAGFWDEWFENVFNIKTANEFGLSVWAIILGVSFEVPNCPGKTLTVEQKRLIIRLRFYQLTTRCTVPMINAELADLFGEGNAYVLDTLNMGPTTYVFRNQPTNDVALVLLQYDLLPRPSAVGSQLRVASNANAFGFGKHNKNFNNGCFYGGDAALAFSWQWTIALEFDTTDNVVRGVVTPTAPDEPMTGYDVTLIYTDLGTGAKNRAELVTKADGSFADPLPISSGRWSVVAKLQFQNPLCETVNIESPILEFKP